VPPAPPPIQARIRRLRVLGVVGAAATLGVFCGLAAAGGGTDAADTDPAAPAAAHAPLQQPSPDAAPEPYFDDPGSPGLAPAPPSGGGPPDATSGAS
jgi:hypothetical protein